MISFSRHIIVCLAIFALFGVCAKAEKDNGPTINLDYGKGQLSPNPVSDFTYFVPLISKTPVAHWISEENDQAAQIISHKKKNDGDSFEVECRVKFTGDGCFRNVFDPQDMIEYNKQFFKEGDTIKRLLEYIEFKGASSGCIKIVGRIENGIELIENIEIDFACKGKSPVMISMYNLDCEDGNYNAEHKKSHILVRINKLIFNRCDEDPAMSVEVASIRPASNKEGWMASFAGKMVNIFMPPMKITQSGNDTMLSFGGALNRKENAFIFPKAENLNGMVALVDTNGHPIP